MNKKKIPSLPFWRYPAFIVVMMTSTLLCFSSASAQNTGGDRYNQVQLRVLEMIDRFLTYPVETLNLFQDFYNLGGFPNNLTAKDRVEAQKYLYSLVTALNETGMKPFYGLEDGTLLGYWHGELNQVPRLAYREPGNSGYQLNDVSLGKYYGVCVNDQGQETNCTMTTETPLYTSCIDIDDCTTLVPCGDKWCLNYEIQEYDENQGVLGYVPTTYNCINAQGAFSQTPGQVLKASSEGIITAGTCTFEDGVTLVERQLTGEFANCGETEVQCSDTFIGAFAAVNYDPRWRGWYMDCRAAQVPQFSDPYIFFTFGTVGITYTHPIFNVDGEGRDVFAGVLAIDMELLDVTNFLEATFQDNNFSAAVYEFNEPYYMIGSSTGSAVLAQVLETDESQRCSQEQIDAVPSICKVNRLTIHNFEETVEDIVLRKAHDQLVENALTAAEDDAVDAVREDDNNAASTAYLVTAILYERPQQNVKWRIVVTTPLEEDPEDSILPGEGMYIFLAVLGGLGFFLCSCLFLAFYRRRNERAVQFADFQFTSAFILGSASLNLTIFAFLGTPSDTICLSRMWLFYMLTTTMLAPLFVKAYRTYSLLGRPVAKAMTVKINNRSAWIRTLPIIITQIVILVVFTFVDPPVVTETIDLDDTIPTKGLRCEHETLVFSFTQGGYDLVLLLTGCILAYMTRNVDPRFGDAKALFFAMYNIAFTTLMLSLIITFVDISESGRYSLQAIGIFWATVFSSAAFVLPRLTAAKKERKLLLKRNMRMRSTLESQRRNRADTATNFQLDDQDRHDSEDALKVLICTANVGKMFSALIAHDMWQEC